MLRRLCGDGCWRSGVTDPLPTHLTLYHTPPPGVLPHPSVPPTTQVSLQKGYNVTMKDSFEDGLSKGYQQIYKG